MTKQALCKRAVETLDNGLVSVNFSATAADVCFVVFHFFGHAPHELAARVNLQHLRPSQRAASVNRLESLRNFGRVFRGQRLSIHIDIARMPQEMTPKQHGKSTLVPKQFGNKKWNSTETSILQTTDTILEAIEKKQLTATVLLEMSKAFDSVDHEIQASGYWIVAYRKKIVS